MHLPLLQIINLSIILVVLIFLIKYIYDIFFGETYQPPSWERAVKFGKLSPDLIKATRNYQDKVRLYTFWLQIDRLSREGVSGDFAELGVYKGHSAKLIHLMAPQRILHLFDTFNGFTSLDLKQETGEATEYNEKSFADTSLTKVLSYIAADQSYLKAHSGYFPETTKDLHDTRYAFVHIDADLYLPTKAGLDYFYPKLNPGGVIIVHDYNHKWEGLCKAVDEFVASIPETPILIADLDSSVMIVKNSNK